MGVKRYEIKDLQWSRVAPMLPGKAGDPGRTAADNRLFVNAVLWVLRSGARWSDLPERYGRFKSVHKRFTRWSRAGVWERVFNELSRDRDNEYLMIDSAIVRAHTRRAYARATGEFLGWCSVRGVTALEQVAPLHVAAWIEELGREVSVPTAKQRLAGVRHLFDWLVIGQVVPVNPAASVRGPAHSVRRGKTPVLDAREARALLDSIDTTTPVGLRDRALIGLMVYSFARIGAALAMRVEDVFVQNRRLWVRLHEKGGKRHEMPCHHNLEEYLTVYIDGCGLREDRKGPLFRTIARGTRRLSGTPLPQANAFQMVRRRAHAAEIATVIGNHSFRATGIYRLPPKWRYFGAGRDDAKSCLDAHHTALRPTIRRYEARRGRAGADLSCH